MPQEQQDTFRLRRSQGLRLSLGLALAGLRESARVLEHSVMQVVLLFKHPSYLNNDRMGFCLCMCARGNQKAHLACHFAQDSVRQTSVLWYLCPYRLSVSGRCVCASMYVLLSMI